jgi:hypothetical protein
MALILGTIAPMILLLGLIQAIAPICVAIIEPAATRPTPHGEAQPVGSLASS